MQNTPTSPNPVYVYPLPAKTQGPQGDSKAYKISLGILWACFALPIIGAVCNIDFLILSYISTNIFIIFFVIYFEFYKIQIFRRLVLLTTFLVLPAAHAANLIIRFTPSFSPRGFGEVYPIIEFYFFIGIVFFIFLHFLNAILNIFLRKNIKFYIIPIILCEINSFIFYFICLAISMHIYESIMHMFIPKQPQLF